MSQEYTFDWQPFTSSTFGRVSYPVAPVEIKDVHGEWKIFYPQVDSGAIVSVFNKTDCERLGLELNNGKPWSAFGILGGDATPAYIHELEIRLAGVVTKVRIAFTDGKNHLQLLGRIDVFNTYRFCLGGRALKTSVIKE